jgi:type I restriction enzyme M protein
MIDTTKFNSVVSFLWAIADLLNGAFRKSDLQKVILPFTVRPRLGYALEATKAKVLQTEHKLKGKCLENRHGQLCRAAGYGLYNTSNFTYESRLHDDVNLALNLRQYVMGFSPNVREIFNAFNVYDAIRDLEQASLMYLRMERFNKKSKVHLRPASMPNHEMRYFFQQLLRKFNEAPKEEIGEYFSRHETIRLMVDLVLMSDTELASGEGTARTVNDCSCYARGIVSITGEHILQKNPQAQVFLRGQEMHPQTWSVARSDMLILESEGKDAEVIKIGSTRSDDQLTNRRFDYQFVNPTDSYYWIKDEAAVRHLSQLNNMLTTSCQSASAKAAA